MGTIKDALFKADLLLDKTNRLAARLDSDWDESKHPRAEDGKFGSGGNKPNEPIKRAMAAAQEHDKKEAERKAAKPFDFVHVSPEDMRKMVEEENAAKGRAESILSGTKDLFSQGQLDTLRNEYSKVETVDPASPSYEKLIGTLDKMSQPQLKQVVEAKVKFLSSLARNRVKGS